MFNCCRHLFEGIRALRKPQKSKAELSFAAGATVVVSERRSHLVRYPRRQWSVRVSRHQILPLINDRTSVIPAKTLLFSGSKGNHFNPRLRDSFSAFSHWSHVWFEREFEGWKKNNFCFCFIHFKSPRLRLSNLKGYRPVTGRQVLRSTCDWFDRFGHLWARDSDIKLVPVSQFLVVKCPPAAQVSSKNRGVWVLGV